MVAGGAVGGVPGCVWVGGRDGVESRVPGVSHSEAGLDRVRCGCGQRGGMVRRDERSATDGTLGLVD